MMGKYIASLVLISSLIFGTTIQSKIIESTLNFEGTKYDTITKSSVRGIEKSTLKVFNKKYGKNSFHDVLWNNVSESNSICHNNNIIQRINVLAQNALIANMVIG